MHINIVTLFPEFFEGPLGSSLMKRAQDAGIVSFSLVNPRDYTSDKHHTADDRPYGGGPGMVMLAQPMAKALRALGYTPRGGAQPGRLVYLSPKGRPLTQALARELSGMADEAAKYPGGHAHPAGRAEAAAQCHDGETGPAPAAAQGRAMRVLTLVCGRYEGLDARIEELFPVEAVSVGDFVLNGGESAAVCLVEAVTRLLPGFMGHEESGAEESFSAQLLEYPHYTRPEEFEGLYVPEVLKSGDHGSIARWRRQASLFETLRHRPELLQKASLEAADYAFLRKVRVRRDGAKLYCALVHHPVLDKGGNSVTVSLTNLDIHDIARSSCTYGLGGYYVVTPLDDQRELLQSILAHWSTGAGKAGNPDRDRALGLVRGVSDIEDAIDDVTALAGQAPLVVGTSALPADPADRARPPVMGFERIVESLRDRPVLLLFGTGHGLAPQVNTLCHAFAPPLRWHGGYNHLSVRSAAAIVFDRILGDWR